MSICKAIFDVEVPAFDVTEVTKAIRKCVDGSNKLGGRRRAQVPDPSKPLRLLPPRRERPRKPRAAQKPDEFAPPHVLPSTLQPYHTVIGNNALCNTANVASNVAVGSNSEVGGRKREVRFTP
jgi:hypothetical protein